MYVPLDGSVRKPVPDGIRVEERLVPFSATTVPSGPIR